MFSVLLLILPPQRRFFSLIKLLFILSHLLVWWSCIWVFMTVTINVPLIEDESFLIQTLQITDGYRQFYKLGETPQKLLKSAFILQLLQLLESINKT